MNMYPDNRLIESAVICPHCWTTFYADQAKYIATHIEMHGDDVLGLSEKQRLTAANVSRQRDGTILDPKGGKISERACPVCHLQIPVELLQKRPHFISIVGAPSAGKTYFITSMIHDLRRQLIQCGYCLQDSDSHDVKAFLAYERELFHARDPDQMREAAILFTYPGTPFYDKLCGAQSASASTIIDISKPDTLPQEPLTAFGKALAMEWSSDRSAVCSVPGLWDELEFEAGRDDRFASLVDLHRKFRAIRSKDDIAALADALTGFATASDEERRRVEQWCIELIKKLAKVGTKANSKALAQIVADARWPSEARIAAFHEICGTSMDSLTCLLGDIQVGSEVAEFVRPKLREYLSQNPVAVDAAIRNAVSEGSDKRNIATAAHVLASAPLDPGLRFWRASWRHGRK